MNLFGRKPANGSEPRVAEYRLMLDLERARVLGAMIAKSRASDAMEIPDLLAGMYISNWDRLSRYWRAEKQEDVEEFLRKICQISPQRWNAWIQHYDAERNKTASRPIWDTLLKRNSSSPEANMKPSASLAAVLKEAESVSPFRDNLSKASIPVLTSECVLLCMARTPGSEIARKLIESGLDAERLEHDARHPRGAPKN